MSDYIYFRALNEKGNKFLPNRTGMINLYFPDKFISLGPVLSSAPGSPLHYIIWSPTTPITCLSCSFSSLGSDDNGNLTDQIPAPWELCIPWHCLLWQEDVCNTPLLMAACASGGQGKAVIPGKMNFCRPGALWGTNSEGKQQWSLLLPHGATRQAGLASMASQHSACSGSKHRPRVKWGYDRSVKGKGFLLWDSISEVVTWQSWVGCWFSEDCQKAMEWVAV